MRSGSGNPIRSSYSSTRSPDPSPVFAVVQGHHLAHLAADPHGRVQCRHRFLENHRDHVAAKFPQFLLGASHYKTNRKIVSNLRGELGGMIDDANNLALDLYLKAGEVELRDRKSVV